MALVLIAGCGDVGTRLGLLLAADGDVVRGLRRNPDALPAPIRGVRADLATGDGLRAAAEGVQILIYAAAADGFSDDAYRAAYVDGLRNVLDALTAASAPLERVVFTSSTAVYGQSDGSWVDETSPTDPQGFSGRRLLEAERAILGCGTPAAVLRLAGIYGSGRTRLIEEVRGGSASVPEGGDPLWTNRIHADDCAGALRHLLRLPAEAMSGVWLGVDDEPCERAVVLDWLADRLGVAQPRRVPVVDGPARVRPGDAAQQPTVGAAPSPRRGANKRCSNAKLKGAGYAFRFPSFREGYADVIARLDERST
jgi:nucleoside-diphosphate-sugar epimerase